MSTSVLPEGYHEVKKVDLQEDKKAAVILNLAAVAVFIIMLFLAPHIYRPIVGETVEFDFLSLVTSLIVLIISFISYIVLHEGVHALFMFLLARAKPTFGFSGLYAYAGSDHYFSKGHYIIIALAPIVLLGALLAVLCVFLPGLFWLFYLLQCFNISGAVGDIYITLLVLRFPRDLLIYDSGKSMILYSKK